jgi:IS30 family transposase
MSKLLYEEVIKIEVYLRLNRSHRKIWKQLWRSNSTISDEIKKNSDGWIYIAKIARVKRQTRRKVVNILLAKVELSEEVEDKIINWIKQYRSPEQISNCYNDVSVPTIYKYIKLQNPELIKYLRRWWKEYNYWNICKSKIYDRISISKRPISAKNKTRYGHREWDLVHWKYGYLLTYVERKSWYLLCWIIWNKKARTIIDKTIELFEWLPRWMKRTITYDNWTEFSEHFMLRSLLRIKTYFADVGNPWQRWTNENTNWLLRQFLTRKRNFIKVSNKELENIINLINNRPRKRLSYLSPIKFLKKRSVRIWI